MSKYKLSILLHPVLFLFCYTSLFSHAQETKQCDAPVKGIKKISSTAENSDFFVPDKVIDYFNHDGLATKTETYHDALLTKIDTFIYDHENKLKWRNSIDPITKHVFQTTEYFYDKNGLNHRTLATTISLDMTDSVRVDTIYHSIRSDFVRDNNTFFTERKTYIGKDEINEFDTLTFNVTYQKQIGDSLVLIEDHSAGRIERTRKQYEKCLKIRTEFLDENGVVTSAYEYEYGCFNAQGHWQIQEVYKIENGERKLINRFTREIERY